MSHYDSLSRYEQWCARSNVERIESGERTVEQMVNVLIGNGYPSVAAAVAELAASHPRAMASCSNCGGDPLTSPPCAPHP